MKQWKNLLPAFAFLPTAVLAVCVAVSLGDYSAPILTAETPQTDTESTKQNKKTTTTKKSTSVEKEEIPTVTPVSETATYKDGTYTGTGTGYGGEMTVQVTIAGGKITDIQILSSKDDSPYLQNASALLERIIATQSTNVDTVSGATYSSVGLITAVRDALQKAGGSSESDSALPTLQQTAQKSSAESPSVSNVSEPTTYKDGTYTGTGTGYGGEMTVQVTVFGGKITDIQILSSKDDSPYLQNASALLQRIISSQSTNVDTVSGATYSSVGLITAVRNALQNAGGDSATQNIASVLPELKKEETKKETPKVEKVTEPSAYKDGTYTGTGTGFGGEMTVQVKVSGGKIADIQVLSSKDDSPYLENASALLKKIIAAQSTNVDAVSGATFSSAGLIEAVRNALADAANTKTTETTAQPGKQTTTETTAVQPQETGKFPYPDGVYTGSGEGYRGETKLSLTLKDGTITKIDILSTDDDESFFQRAEALVQQVIQKQTTEIDAVSGATFSSEGILEAVSDALDAAKAAAEPTVTTTVTTTTAQTTTTVPSTGTSPQETTTEAVKKQYADGVYTGTATCNPDEDEDFEAYTLSVEVTIEDGQITGISKIKGTGSNYDSSNNAYISRAADGTKKISGTVAQILENQNANGIDAVSGATCSSDAIVEAVENALEQARKGV